MLSGNYERTQPMAGSTELVELEPADKLSTLASIVLVGGLSDDQIKNKSDEIIEVLGGIEGILSVFITNKHLCDNQIDKLHNILSPSSITDDEDKSTALPTSTSAISLKMGSFQEDVSMPDAGNLELQITEDVKIQQRKLKIYLNEEHTFWQRILPNTKQELSERITWFILFSNWSYAIIIFLFLLSMLFRSFLPYLQIIPAIFSSVWFICFLLTFNVSMTKRMTRSFVFWYKMYNWITFIFCYILLFSSSSIIYLEAINWIAGTLVIAAVSLHDGCRWKKCMKTWTGMLVWICLIAAYLFIYVEGLPKYFGQHYQFRDDTAIILGEAVSVKSNCLSAMFNLILFIGKQVFSMIKNGDKASVLSIKPKVIWCKDSADMKQKILNDDA